MATIRAARENKDAGSLKRCKEVRTTGWGPAWLAGNLTSMKRHEPAPIAWWPDGRSVAVDGAPCLWEALDAATSRWEGPPGPVDPDGSGDLVDRTYSNSRSSRV